MGYWISTFASQVTDGNAVFSSLERFTNYVQKVREEATDSTNHDELNLGPPSFQRVFPRSQESKKFQMSDQEIDRMVEVIEIEAKTDVRYFQDILTAAVIIAARIVESVGKANFWFKISLLDGNS